MTIRNSEEAAASWHARKRRIKPDSDIVLLCNPRAGGRWKELAAILDSPEAKYVRRIVTDSVEDIAPAVTELGRGSKLLCIYGGDGTIQRILDRLTPAAHENVQMALIGGGTMNVTARWCGLSGTPAENFRAVVQAYQTGHILFREVPLLEVRHGAQMHRGFTFGMGPIVRVLDAYERGRKGKIAAVEMAAKAALASWTGWPRPVGELVARMRAEVAIDDEVLPDQDFSAVFANVTGQINPGVEPFAERRRRDSFHIVAYSVTAKELSAALPLLARGWLPFDWTSLAQPINALRSVGKSAEASKSRFTYPTDRRYVNRTGRALCVSSEEQLYTIDGEILVANEGRLDVQLGPTIKLAVTRAGPRVQLGSRVQLGAR